MSVDQSWFVKPKGTRNRTSAGGIIVRSENGSWLVALVRGEGDGEGYVLPKGGVDKGETLEQAAVREVAEEVGVHIGNLRYAGSQPWPFPHSLMMGFYADYVSGDIVCQEDEIAEADWFRLNELPEIPPEQTLSGQMIRYLQQEFDKAQ